MKNLIKIENRYSPGIYQIRNIVNNKVYIGSAFVLYDRFRSHKSSLKSNKHINNHLQRSYNKYGPESFIFEVLEVLENVDNIYEIEKKYIKIVFGSSCYNINIETSPSESLIQYNDLRKKKITLISPQNEEFEFSSLCESARIIKCHVSAIYRLYKGINKSCKGWRRPEHKDYDYENYRKVKNKGAKLHDVKLLGPDGIVYGPIFNMEEFARNHNLNSSVFSNIISGRTRYSNGWSLYTGELVKPLEKNAKEYKLTLISPSGNEFKNIRNLTKFCKDQKLPISSIRDLINGKIKRDNYKGWSIKK